MPRTSVLQNQFTRGELSPKMNGRVDLEQYYQGVQTMVNFLPVSHGGASGRPGTRYVASTKDPTKVALVEHDDAILVALWPPVRFVGG